MTQPSSRMQVLLVEDEPEDMRQYVRDLPDVFSASQVEADIHPCGDFDEAHRLTSRGLCRFDLIVSDTYRGPTKNRDALVLRMVQNYRGTRFCPLVIYSSGVKPPELREGAFLVWADKSKPKDIERAVKQLLSTRIPQLARQLHEDLEGSTGSYLWSFLEERWDQLNTPMQLDPDVLERMVRRRAAIQIGDIDPSSGTGAVLERHAPEYYVYPAFPHESFNLGDVLRSRQDNRDWRVILTPHCHLAKQPNQAKPRAERVLLIKAVEAEVVLGDKLDSAKAEEGAKQEKRLRKWARSPAQTDRPPEGRHWYLPSFLDIPHLFCDFMQVESVCYEKVVTGFDRIATLVPPYAEAMQSCFASFYASVGLPNIRTQSIQSLLT